MLRREKIEINKKAEKRRKNNEFITGGGNLFSAGKNFCMQCVLVSEVSRLINNSRLSVLVESLKSNFNGLERFELFFRFFMYNISPKIFLRKERIFIFLI